MSPWPRPRGAASSSRARSTSFSPRRRRRADRSRRHDAHGRRRPSAAAPVESVSRARARLRGQERPRAHRLRRTSRRQQGSPPTPISYLSRFAMRAAGTDTVGAEIGTPLSVALALMKDTHGDIHLDLPIEGDVGSERISRRQPAPEAPRHGAPRHATRAARVPARHLPQRRGRAIRPPTGAVPGRQRRARPGGRGPRSPSSRACSDVRPRSAPC